MYKIRKIDWQAHIMRCYIDPASIWNDFYKNYPPARDLFEKNYTDEMWEKFSSLYVDCMHYMKYVGMG